MALSKQTTLFCALSMALSFSISPVSAAADASSTTTSDNGVKARYLDLLKGAEPLERVAPKYPKSMARKNMEGWVRVSFVVDETGAVVDPIIHDSSGLKAFEKSALEAVGQWRFEPATLNGEPIEQCNSKVQLDFKLLNRENSVTRSFMKRYKKLKAALTENKLEEAAEIHREFSERTQRNFTENVHFSVISAMYFQAIGDNDRLSRELINIVNNGHEYLPADSYLSFVYNRLAEQIQTNRLAAAKDTAEKAIAHFPEHAMTKEIIALTEKVDSFVSENEAFVVSGKIHGDRTWSHKLLHNKFEVSAENSKFDRIEVRCDNKRSSFGGVSYQTVEVPDEWGQCYIYVDAPADTEFSLVEIAS